MIRCLDPYGGLGAYDRSSQVSDSFVSAEIEQLQGMAMVVPPIFFAISAFLVGMVMSRIVGAGPLRDRAAEGIGLIPMSRSACTYLLLAAMIAVLGVCDRMGNGHDPCAHDGVAITRGSSISPT